MVDLQSEYYRIRMVIAAFITLHVYLYYYKRQSMYYSCVSLSGYYLQASEREVIIVMRIAIMGVTGLALIMALTVESIYILWYLCADLVYVILFPQLICVIYMDSSNTYGSLAGYVFGLFFRVSGGEPNLNIPALIEYPMYANNAQSFPFKTLAMLVSLLSLTVVSYVTKYVFENGLLPRRYDVFMCIVNIPVEQMVLASRESVDERTKFGLYSEKNGGNVNPALKFSQDDLITADDTESDYDMPSERKASIQQ